MLETLDLTRRLDRASYVREITRRQIQLRELGYQVYLQKRPVVIAFEGWDAAGKGGAIKRITEKLDPRGYVVYPISAPEGEDKTRHYLYRFWRRLPAHGQIAIFDRSWYGRVLVERVEGFAAEAEWKRGYKEINSFERQLRDFGAILVKFWIHISREEQLRRFEERKAIGYKSWKLTEEDLRNREKWSAYEEAVEQMLVKTSTATAPWTLVEGNDKYWARTKVLEKLVKVLSDEMDYRPADPLPKAAAKERRSANPSAHASSAGLRPAVVAASRRQSFRGPEARDPAAWKAAFLHFHLHFVAVRIRIHPHLRSTPNLATALRVGINVSHPPEDHGNP